MKGAFKAVCCSLTVKHVVVCACVECVRLTCINMFVQLVPPVSRECKSNAHTVSAECVITTL